jgi:gas vesicle protein
MAREDTNDFIAAFGIGAVLGIGAALLLRPERPDPRRRLLRRVKPHAKQLRRGAKRVRRAAREEYRDAADLGGEAIEHGRELMHEFRAEVRRILDEARRELHALGGTEGARPGAVSPPPGGEG